MRALCMHVCMYELHSGGSSESQASQTDQTDGRVLATHADASMFVGDQALNFQ